MGKRKYIYKERTPMCDDTEYWNYLGRGRTDRKPHIVKLHSYIDTINCAEDLHLWRDNKKDHSRRHSRSRGYGGFYHYQTFEECMHAARYGSDTSELEQFHDRFKYFTSVFTAQSKAYAYDIQGQALDVGQYMTGQPECFIDELEVATKPFIRVILSCCFTDNVGQTQIINRGAMAMALVEELERTHNVEVLVVDAALNQNSLNNGDDKDGNCILIYPVSTSPLDVETCYFSLASPDMLRRVSFAVIENFYQVSTGGSASIIKNILDCLPEDWAAGTLYFDSMNYDDFYESTDNCINMINYCLEHVHDADFLKHGMSPDMDDCREWAEEQERKRKEGLIS